eukprot:2330162-Pyramimonas_sp.AAC.1
MAFRWSRTHARVQTGNGAASHSLRSGAPWPAPGWCRPLLMTERFQWVSRYSSYLTVPGPRVRQVWLCALVGWRFPPWISLLTSGAGCAAVYSLGGDE